MLLSTADLATVLAGSVTPDQLQGALVDLQSWCRLTLSEDGERIDLENQLVIDVGSDDFAEQDLFAGCTGGPGRVADDGHVLPPTRLPDTTPLGLSPILYCAL